MPIKVLYSFLEEAGLYVTTFSSRGLKPLREGDLKGEEGGVLRVTA